jgi:hypothetical protein
LISREDEPQRGDILVAETLYFGGLSPVGATFYYGSAGASRVRTFKEYLKILPGNEIPYEEKYLPEFYD